MLDKSSYSRKLLILVLILVLCFVKANPVFASTQSQQVYSYILSYSFSVPEKFSESVVKLPYDWINIRFVDAENSQVVLTIRGDDYYKELDSHSMGNLKKDDVSLGCEFFNNTFNDIEHIRSMFEEMVNSFAGAHYSILSISPVSINNTDYWVCRFGYDDFNQTQIGEGRIYFTIQAGTRYTISVLNRNGSVTVIPEVEQTIASFRVGRLVSSFSRFIWVMVGGFNFTFFMLILWVVTRPRKYSKRQLVRRERKAILEAERRGLPPPSSTSAIALRRLTVVQTLKAKTSDIEAIDDVVARKKALYHLDFLLGKVVYEGNLLTSTPADEDLGFEAREDAQILEEPEMAGDANPILVDQEIEEAADTPAIVEIAIEEIDVSLEDSQKDSEIQSDETVRKLKRKPQNEVIQEIDKLLEEWDEIKNSDAEAGLWTEDLATEQTNEFVVGAISAKKVLANMSKQTPPGTASEGETLPGAQLTIKEPQLQTGLEVEKERPTALTSYIDESNDNKQADIGFQDEADITKDSIIEESEAKRNDTMLENESGTEGNSEQQSAVKTGVKAEAEIGFDVARETGVISSKEPVFEEHNYQNVQSGELPDTGFELGQRESALVETSEEVEAVLRKDSARQEAAGNEDTGAGEARVEEHGEPAEAIEEKQGQGLEQPGANSGVEDRMDGFQADASGDVEAELREATGTGEETGAGGARVKVLGESAEAIKNSQVEGIMQFETGSEQGQPDANNEVDSEKVQPVIGETYKDINQISLEENRDTRYFSFSNKLENDSVEGQEKAENNIEMDYHEDQDFYTENNDNEKRARGRWGRRSNRRK
ncbi:MAG: hypothetical protein FWG10_03120 [Eubacteriaceae bacterium]|nr:hypothetical protein [Eubacteriaceae bacterium]